VSLDEINQDTREIKCSGSYELTINSPDASISGSEAIQIADNISYSVKKQVDSAEMKITVFGGSELIAFVKRAAMVAAVKISEKAPNSISDEEDGDYIHERPIKPASFNCDAAKSQTEITICSDTSLSTDDYYLALFYQREKSKLPLFQVPAYMVEQRAWLTSRDQCGSDKNCISESYMQREMEVRGPAPEGAN
jgi:uncharacterized protein YecT (DUF1311 family)